MFVVLACIMRATANKLRSDTEEYVRLMSEDEDDDEDEDEDEEEGGEFVEELGEGEEVEMVAMGLRRTLSVGALREDNVGS